MKKVNDNSDKQLPALTAEDAALYGERTGQGIRKRDPEKYEAIVRALKHGLSLRQCADVFKVKKDTVGAICVRELGRDGMRRTTENNLRLLAHKASTDLLEQMDQISPSQKSVVMGIVLDKLEKADSRQEVPASLTQNNINITTSPNITREAVLQFFEKIQSAPESIDISTNKEKEHDEENNH
jgi:DNA-directed RNA polymerase specialized sigma24 family protein